MNDFRTFEQMLFPKWINQFRSGDVIGEFSFEKGGPTSLYGTTDMLISTFILDDLRLSENQRDEWAKVINRFQDPNTGFYNKIYALHHYREHTSAYAVAALHLIDRKPKFPFSWKYDILKSEKAQQRWIRGRGDNRLLWSIIWLDSHVISGIPAMLAMTKQSNERFYNWYFNWLDTHADPNSGFYHLGIHHRLGLNKIPSKHEMAGAFHMYFVYEWFNREWPYPEKIVDECIRLQNENGLWDKDVTYCIDLDGLYSMIRSSRNAQWYRKKDIEQSVHRYLKTASKIFNDENFFFEIYNNSHILSGALAAIAECQKWFPELVQTNRRWKQSLDYECYI